MASMTWVSNEKIRKGGSLKPGSWKMDFKSWAFWGMPPWMCLLLRPAAISY